MHLPKSRSLYNVIYVSTFLLHAKNDVTEINISFSLMHLSERLKIQGGVGKKKMCIAFKFQ